eukprot:5326710-Alexandrium_andersonii.AAC.1
MADATGAGLAPDEAKTLQRLGVKGLPPVRRGSRLVQTPYEPGAHPGLSHLQGQGHVHVLVDKG